MIGLCCRRRPICARLATSSISEAEGFHLRWCPLVAQKNRDSGGVTARPRFQLARGLQAQWPSTTVPSLRARTGHLNPNSRMLLHIRSTAASFLRGLRA